MQASGQLQARKLYVIQDWARPRAVVDVFGESAAENLSCLQPVSYTNRDILAPECGGKVDIKINIKQTRHESVGGLIRLSV